MKKRRFRVALSFAGEKRTYVEEVAKLLANKFGEEKILYDKFHAAEFATFDLGIKLPKLYGEQSDLIVPILCPKYDAKLWTGWEWVHIYGLLTKADGVRVVPSRFERAIVDGLGETCGYLELDDISPEDLFKLLLQRLARNEGRKRDYYLADVSSPPKSRRRQSGPAATDPSAAPASPQAPSVTGTAAKQTLCERARIRHHELVARLLADPKTETFARELAAELGIPGTDHKTLCTAILERYDAAPTDLEEFNNLCFKPGHALASANSVPDNRDACSRCAVALLCAAMFHVLEDESDELAPGGGGAARLRRMPVPKSLLAAIVTRFRTGHQLDPHVDVAKRSAEDRDTFDVNLSDARADLGSAAKLKMVNKLSYADEGTTEAARLDVDRSGNLDTRLYSLSVRHASRRGRSPALFVLRGVEVVDLNLKVLDAVVSEASARSPNIYMVVDDPSCKDVLQRKHKLGIDLELLCEHLESFLSLPSESR